MKKIVYGLIVLFGMSSRVNAVPHIGKAPSNLERTVRGALLTSTATASLYNASNNKDAIFSLAKLCFAYYMTGLDNIDSWTEEDRNVIRGMVKSCGYAYLIYSSIKNVPLMLKNLKLIK